MTEEPLAIADYDSLSSFLERCPPGRTVTIQEGLRLVYSEVFGGLSRQPPPTTHLNLVQLSLHCDDDSCGQVTRFHPPQAKRLEGKIEGTTLIRYFCRNCGSNEKYFAFRYEHIEGNCIRAVKLGEHPPFGDPVPSSVISLLGPSREHFLKGRQCEHQGLGIAAFSYYRRIVENSTHRLIKRMRALAERTGSSEEVLRVYDVALEETQFKTALKSVSNSLPQSLYISGQNPLTHLHTAASKALHELSDDQCLQFAEATRSVLVALAVKMQAIKSEYSNTQKALSILQQVNSGNESEQLPGD